MFFSQRVLVLSLSICVVNLCLADTPRRNDSPGLPAGVMKFNGMLVGKIVSKDVEKGTFVVNVDAVSRVWKNSAADNPKSIVGKSIEIGGVFGKFLDVLVVTRVGETIEFECKHDGERLVFPGELLRKVAPYDPQDYPVLPQEFRGFQGAVEASVIKKDPESFELIVAVERVIESWKDSSAKQPKAIEGKKVMLAGFWNRRDEYHGLKVGDKFEVGMQHIGMHSDHLNVAQFVRKVGSNETRERNETPAKSKEAESSDGMAAESRGFRGLLVGRLVDKDIETGTFSIEVDAVPRVWNNNQATKPKSLLGSRVTAEGVSGKLLDVLVVAKIGETIEFGAAHDGGQRMRVMEGLRKVAPVQPDDYPVLPDDFRGFKGTLVAKIVRKDDHTLSIIVEVAEIKNSLPNSKAKDAKSAVGKPATLAGFWNRKDAFHKLVVGDVAEFSVDHVQPLSDHLGIK